MIHPNSVVQTSAIGDNTTVWQYCIILSDAVIGNNCNINCHVFIENDVLIGNNVTIKSGVQIWDGLTIEDNVFVGPNVTFTNDLYPRSKRRQDSPIRTVLKEGASIGGGATILAGITIGSYSMIGAGSVVTKDIPNFELWLGNPAKHIGYVTKEGEVLNLSLKSKKNGIQYIRINNSPVKRIDFRLKAENISMRLIDIEDAKFIVSIRTNSRVSRFISTTSPEIRKQIIWIEEYFKREALQKEYYFIYEDDTSKPWGAIRLYDITNEGFTIGSWISLFGDVNYVSVKAWLLAVEFGFEQLNFENCFLDVRKENLYVLYYLKFFHPELIKENELNYYFKFNKKSFYEGRERALKILKIKL